MTTTATNACSSTGRAALPVPTLYAARIAATATLAALATPAMREAFVQDHAAVLAACGRAAACERGGITTAVYAGGDVYVCTVVRTHACGQVVTYELVSGGHVVAYTEADTDTLADAWVGYLCADMGAWAATELTARA